MNTETVADARWMEHALALAAQAAAAGEVPVGALMVRDGELIGEGRNQSRSLLDPSAHAEIQALRTACRRVGNYRLPGAVLYVSIEPCAMCAGALVHARVSRLVYGAAEPRAGAVVSRARLLDGDYLNHRVVHSGGCLAPQSAALLQAFFRQRRG
ncbi:MAG: nucleoside deaminase [Cellvibrionales bacterium]|nr:nucleoside deaminase [Cellvibrionales bacterium]